MRTDPVRSEGVAPVIPLFGDGGASETSGGSERAWTSTWDDAGSSSSASVEGDSDGDGPAPAAVELAERSLLRKLRGRSLSVAEARTALASFALAASELDAVVERCENRGYLDDAALAEQLVHVGVSRKGQGRRAIALALAKRGIPRAVAETALAALPDDDAERALEFARTKAAALSRYDEATALRRLTGQLARRGYPGAVASAAARAALSERGGAGGVRFR